MCSFTSGLSKASPLKAGVGLPLGFYWPDLSQGQSPVSTTVGEAGAAASYRFSRWRAFWSSYQTVYQYYCWWIYIFPSPGYLKILGRKISFCKAYTACPQWTAWLQIKCSWNMLLDFGCTLGHGLRTESIPDCPHWIVPSSREFHLETHSPLPWVSHPLEKGWGSSRNAALTVPGIQHRSATRPRRMQTSVIWQNP